MVTCLYCEGEVPKIIAKQCRDCGAYFHLAHYHAHRREWPCPRELDDWCLWCNQRIEEEQNKVHCPACHCNLHEHCHSAHLLCPTGWINKDAQPAVDEEPKDEPPSDVRSMVARIEALENNNRSSPEVGNDGVNRSVPPTQLYVTPEMAARASGYPLSPVRHPPGIDGISGLPVNLADTLVATDPSGHTGFAVQYSKPREADSVKLMSFPKPGIGFERWWDHALDSISASTSYCTEAYRWAVVCEKSETTFDSLGNSGSFVRLDALLLTALMDCIPGDHIHSDNKSRRPRASNGKPTSEISLDGKYYG